MATDRDELYEEIRKRNRRDAWYFHLWRGMLSGVGAVLGIALLVYLLLPFLRHIPVIGPFIERYSEPIESTAEDRLPSSIRQQETSNNTTSTSNDRSSTDSSSASRVSGRTSVNTNYYSLALPAGWDLKLNEGSRGVQLSRLEAESSDYASHTDEVADGPFVPTYIDAGASLVVHIVEPIGDSGEHGQVLEERTVTVDGVEATWHQYAEPSTASGVHYDVHFQHDGRAYLITFSAADSYPDPAQAFEAILDSLVLK